MTTERMGRILVIDDEIGPRESLRILLKTHYEIFTADRVDVGLEKLIEHHPDLIIMDIRMPGKTGIEGLREIRKINPTISVIMLTGYGALETAQDAIRLGANDYLKKPFDMHEIQEVVARNIARSRIETRKATAEAQLDDLSERLNATLNKRDNMTDIGLASTELVNDLRNPLTVVLGYIQLMKQELLQLRTDNQQTEMAEYISQIESQLRRCTQLTEDWQHLGQNTPNQMQQIILQELISKLVADIRQTQPKVDIELPEPTECPPIAIRANKDQISRAFLNIFSNATQATQNGQPNKISVAYAVDGDRIVTTIKDNGCGIDPEKIQWIFNPLSSFRQTAKKGLGLGLFITKKIIENHNGTLALESQPYLGTTVTVALPRVSTDKDLN